MENRIKVVVASVLNIDIDSIDDTTSPDTVVEWDSLKQMNLIVALEEEFEIIFSDDDVVNMLNFKLIKLIIEELCG